MEQKLHQVVRDQQDQAQPVEAKRDWRQREDAIKDPIRTNRGDLTLPSQINKERNKAGGLKGHFTYFST